MFRRCAYANDHSDPLLPGSPDCVRERGVGGSFVLVFALDVEIECDRGDAGGSEPVDHPCVIRSPFGGSTVFASEPLLAVFVDRNEDHG